ncbi:MAG TPA: TolC family protein, partial [Bacteroidota bacterium]|nr:TolC family protein [Bacteroidota bacterium]
NRETALLLQKIARIAQTRFGLGSAPQQDVLKTYVEIARLDNQLVELRQQEVSAKSMLMALLNRPVAETLGIAYVPPRTAPLPPADTLVHLALRFRGMLLHDSLSVEEAERMVALAKREYLPDITLGIEYVTRPGTRLNAWSVSAGISIPFMPWGITRVGARVEETTIAIEKARQTLINARSMVRSNILMLYAKAQGLQQQLDNFTNVIVPQSERSLQASLIAYQTGKADYIMLIDAYRMLVELSMEKLMLRMQFEQAVAELKREVGYAGIFERYAERD